MKKFLIFIAVTLVVNINYCFAQSKHDFDYNIYRALEYIEDGKIEDALYYIEQQIKESPTDVYAYLLRAGYHCTYGDFGLALEDINRMIQYAKRNKEAMFYAYRLQGMIYSELEEYDAAVLASEHALKYSNKVENKEHIKDVKFLLADIYSKQQNYLLADKVYREILEENTANITAIIGLARNMYERGEYHETISLLDKYERYDANNGATYELRMQAYDKIGECEKAIDNALLYFEKAENPDEALFGKIFKTNLSYALTQLSEKIKSDDSWAWRMLRTTLYEWANDYAHAIAEYNIIEQGYGEHKAINYYRADCYKALGEMDKAIEDISKIINQSGDDYNLLVTRAQFYHLAGEYQKAIEDLSVVIENNSFIAYSFYLRGLSYDQIGNYEAAMNDYTDGISVDGSSHYIYLSRGRLYLKQGDRHRAQADFEEVIKLDTVVDNNPSRCYALHFLGRDAEAIEWINKVIEKDPEYNVNYYDKACIYALMGKKLDAIDALRIALEKDFYYFAHIESDDDLDAIRDMAEFNALIDEYKNRPRLLIDNKIEQESTDTIQAASEIQMRKMYSGVYEVPCTINDLPLKFIFDTGASTTTISSVEAVFMLKNGYLKQSDIKGKEYYSTATGEIQEGTVIRLREIKIGDTVLRNVDASVTHSQQAPLLLGQSVMERFGTITIDNTTSKLTIKQK